MSELAARKCKPCEGGVAPLARAEAERLLAQVSRDWALTEGARAIRREFAFRDFYRTISFVNALAHIANIEDHHPDRGRLQLLPRHFHHPRDPRALGERLRVRGQGGPDPVELTHASRPGAPSSHAPLVPLPAAALVPDPLFEQTKSLWLEPARAYATDLVRADQASSLERMDV